MQTVASQSRQNQPHVHKLSHAPLAALCSGRPGVCLEGLSRNPWSHAEQCQCPEHWSKPSRRCHTRLTSHLARASPCSRSNDEYQADTQPKLNQTHRPSLSVSALAPGGLYPLSGPPAAPRQGIACKSPKGTCIFLVLGGGDHLLLSCSWDLMFCGDILELTFSHPTPHATPTRASGTRTLHGANFDSGRLNQLSRVLKLLSDSTVVLSIV